MTWFRYIYIIACLIIAIPEIAMAQRLRAQRQEDIENNIRYDESIYLVSNYSSVSSNEPESLTIEELLQRQVEGFYLYLKKEPDSERLMLRNPNGSFSPFAEALTAIHKSLSEDPLKIITLFLDFYVASDLESAFDKANLLSYLQEYDTQQGWPSLKKMIESNKRLVVFEVQSHMKAPSWLHHISDFVDHSELEWGGVNPAQAESFDKRLKRNLSLFTGYKMLGASAGTTNEISTLARQTPYLIESFKRAWIREGKVPNFVLINNYYPWMANSLVSLRGFNILNGTVTYNNELVSYVNWDNMNNYTGGRFSFPLEPETELMLTPIAPGYQIEPATKYVSANQKKVFTGEFKAKALPIQEAVEIYLPFEADDKGTYYKQAITMHGMNYVSDPERGEVAQFDAESRIDLTTATKLRMRDHDFTVSTWLKIPKYTDSIIDYCVLGSKNSAYQQALHLLIRDHKPYMGFFNNDLVGNSEIQAGKWYHIVWRYNKNNGEQAIFVNGQLDAISLDRPAYLGSDSLYIGYANTSSTPYFDGVMDNFVIWSRVLSDKEILGLNNQLLDLNMSYQPDWSRIIEVTLIIVLIIVTIIYLVSRSQKKKNTPNNNVQQIAIEKKQVYKEGNLKRNYICLFGEFYVSDREGNDITSLFTPKLKQLFLLILLYSSRGGNGIASNDLTYMIWGDDDSGKNNKSVRSVSILKLRKILEKLDHIDVIFNKNRYYLHLSEDIHCDYIDCLNLLKDNQIKGQEEFDHFYSIINRGEIFCDESFDWMDDFKSYICNSIVDVLSHFIDKYPIEEESDKIIQIADQILVNDPSNEDALTYKMKALASQNNFKSAHYAYDKFCSVYMDMYGEAYKKSFEQVLSNQN